MTNKKNHYYVLVMSNEGPKFVTRLGEKHMCFWDEKEAPKEFPKTFAEDIAFGLRMNMHTAYVVMSPMEENYHPYDYENWDCTFVEKHETEDDFDDEE